MKSWKINIQKRCSSKSNDPGEKCIDIVEAILTIYTL